MFNVIEIKNKDGTLNTMNAMKIDPYNRVVVNQPAFPYVDASAYATATVPQTNIQNLSTTVAVNATTAVLPNPYANASCSKQTETIAPAPKFTKKGTLRSNNRFSLSSSS